MNHYRKRYFVIWVTFFVVANLVVLKRPERNALQAVWCDVTIENHDVSLGLHQNTSVAFHVSNLTKEAVLSFSVQHDDIVRVLNGSVELHPNRSRYEVVLEATAPGHSGISVNTTDPDLSTKQAFLMVTVYKNSALDVISTIIGWVYFAAWSISFYPQIYSNYERKSVIGLNFDFVVLNLVGFVLYSIFNLGLYTIPEIKEEYFDRYPRGLNPVQLNDIVFAVHAAIATALTIVQCFIYERGGQTVSLTARSILGVFAACIGITIVLSLTGVLHWLDFLYICSYIKLTITLIKYVPQAYMNYKRKSTIGWSIGNVLLDFVGGMLSMLQMILLSYNYDDWVSIFGDPTKFGLGLFSVTFDIFFILQHYVLYRETQYEAN